MVNLFDLNLNEYDDCLNHKELEVPEKYDLSISELKQIIDHTTKKRGPLSGPFYSLIYYAYGIGFQRGKICAQDTLANS